MNVYDFIRVVNFPVKLALGIGIKLGFEPGEDGDETKTLIVVNQNNGIEVAKMEANTRIPHDKEEVKLNFASNAQGFSFPEEGRYTFKLSVDGAEIGETSILLKKE